MDALSLSIKITPITRTPSHITTSHTSISVVSPNKPKTWPWGFPIKNSLTSLVTVKCNRYNVVTVDDTVVVDKNGEGQNGNWVFRVLQMWNSKEQVYNQESDHQSAVSKDRECDACMVDNDEENDKLEFNKDSFLKLLLTVSLSEARLYAQMAYLGSLSYTIPKIKLGNLLRRHKLRFVTSSLEMKAKKEKASEEVKLQDSESVVIADNLSSSSPCEWYICDDDESSTRYFVIQGSESLASWQANLIFEPIQFEAMDALVHRGIYEAAKVVYEQMLPQVHEHLQRHGNRATIRLTGHSLGGSLSTLINLMLLIRGQVPLSSLLPVITFGAPWVMCGGDRLLHNLGLPRNHLQGITMHRDIVPRAFSCNYPTQVGDFLRAVNGNFRNHPCLNNQNLLYAPMGEFLILQPDAKLSPSHDLLPSGSGLYVLKSQALDADVAKKQILAAQSIFLNTPHPLEILTDRCAYGSDGAILRDHDVDTYLVSIRNVISQELNRVRKMRRQHRQYYWLYMMEVNKSQVKSLLDCGRVWWKMIFASHHMHMLVVVLVPYARLLIIEAFNWIRRRWCM